MSDAMDDECFVCHRLCGLFRQYTCALCPMVENVALREDDAAKEVGIVNEALAEGYDVHFDEHGPIVQHRDEHGPIIPRTSKDTRPTPPTTWKPPTKKDEQAERPQSVFAKTRAGIAQRTGPTMRAKVDWQLPPEQDVH